jgi:hypothetical protein
VTVAAAEPDARLPLAEVTWEAPLPGGWARDFRLGEWLGDPVTPLFESWLLTRIEDRFHGFYGRLLGIALPEPTHVIVNGWYFYGLNFLPATPRGMLAMMVRHVLPRLVVHPRRTAIAFPPLARFAVGTYDAMWHDELQPRYREQARAAAAEVEVASGERLIALVDELADAAGDVFGVVTAVGGYASKAEVPLARFHASHLAATIGGSHLDLLEGLGSAPPELAPHAVRTIDWIEPSPRPEARPSEPWPPSCMRRPWRGGSQPRIGLVARSPPLRRGFANSTGCSPSPSNPPRPAKGSSRSGRCRGRRCGKLSFALRRISRLTARSSAPPTSGSSGVTSWLPRRTARRASTPRRLPSAGTHGRRSAG